MSARRRILAVLPASLALVLGACSGGGDSSAARSSASATSHSASSPSASAVPAATVSPSASGDGSADEEPTAAPAFAADISAEAGPAQAGSTGDPAGKMHITAVRLEHHEGYDRVIIELNTAGVPEWTAHYGEATGPGGGPLTIAGDAFLRVSLKTSARPGIQTPSTVSSDSGIIAQAKTTGFFEGHEEVMTGVWHTTQPFRASVLTDPGRIVVDVLEP